MLGGCPGGWTSDSRSPRDRRPRQVDLVMTLMRKASEARATTLAMLEESSSQLDIDLTQQALERAEREKEKRREQAEKMAAAQRSQQEAAAKLVGTFPTTP